MWITKLQLSNIKSYGPDSPVIVFQPGVNLIQGSNGAGKSTILEAIGLALFDSKPYNLGQFVREGEKSGKITVGFMSALDEREYEAVRQVGGGSQSYIYDPEVGRKLCEGREDTLAFIREHLGLEAETDLTTLFEDAIGVPQGTMTAAFRERPADRKQKFNRLLNIDMYERAWNSLLQTGNYIRDLIARNEQEQSELRGMLRDRPVVEAAIREQAATIAESEAALEKVQADLQAVVAAVEAADAVRGQLDSLEARLTTARGELRESELHLQQARKAHAEALNAASVVDETREAYSAYEAARRSLEAAEQERTARDHLQHTLHDLNTRAQVTAQKLERIQQDLAAVAQAEEELAQLEPLTTRQQDLEQALKEAQQAGQEAERLAAHIARQRDRVEQQGLRLADILAAADLEMREPGALPDPDAPEPLEELTAQAAEALGETQRVFDQWQAANEALDRSHESVAGLGAQLARRRAHERDLEAARARWRELEQQVTDRRLDLSQAERDLAQLEDYEALLTTTGATCPVCRQPVDDHAQAEAQAHYAAERARLGGLQQEHEAALAGLEDQLQAAQAGQTGLEAALAALPSAAALDEARERETQAVAALEDSGARLRATVQRSGAVLAAGRAQLAREDERLAGLEQRAEAREAIQAELDDLGDPHTDQTRARLVADRRPDLELALGVVQADTEGIAAERRTLEEQAARYAGLDARLEALRQQIGDSDAGYTRYLAHIGLAGQVEARQGEVREYEAVVAAQSEALAALEGEREALAAGYDGQQHEADRGTRRQLEDEKLRLATSLDALQKTLAGLQARLAEMDEHARTLGSAETAALRLEERQAAYEFIRQTVREAGPRITRQLVRVISEQANHIFGDLLGDHSYILSWSEDYGITVNSRGEAREFELLSGGEQMVAAMAVRLALLTQLANVRFAFFDEPTTNLDDTRRAQLAASLADIQSLRQLFVISHDDTFEQESYHVIQVYKEQDLSQVEIL